MVDYNPFEKFRKKVTSWVKKWKQNKILDNSWCRFIEISHANPRKIYALIKTHKVGNPVREITSGCGTEIESLSTFFENAYIQKF